MLAGVKDAVLRWDEQHWESRLQKTWWRYCIAGQHWGEFLAEAARDDQRGRRVLDAGAGQGQFRRRFQHASYVAIDTAVGDVTWDYSGLDVMGDLTSLPFADETFDQVFCTEVLEHLLAPAEAVREFARILKVGGRVLLSTPQSWPQHQKPYDFYRYTSYGLTRLFNDAGLSVSWLWPAGGAFTHALTSMDVLLSDDTWAGSKSLSTATRPARRLMQRSFSLWKPMVAVLDRLDVSSDNTVGWFICGEKPAAKPDRDRRASSAISA
jgi:SAM-dependent methyltransferase